MRRNADVPFDHDQIFGAIFTVNLTVEVVAEGARLVLVDRGGEVRQELSDLQIIRLYVALRV